MPNYPGFYDLYAVCPEQLIILQLTQSIISSHILPHAAPCISKFLAGIVLTLNQVHGWGCGPVDN